MKSNISFKIVEYGSPEYFNAVRLREEILRKPFGLKFLPEELEKEKNHIQITGYRDQEIIATAVLVPEGKICKMQRVVVRNDLQNSGIGTKMMEFCERHALSCGFKEIYCHARDSAVQFYLNNHYQPEGDYFMEDTIPHLRMRKVL